MEIIGLSGYARSGKDEASKVLTEKYGFTRVGFADVLRRAVYELNPYVAVNQWDRVDDADILLDLPTCAQGIKIQDVIDRYGWDGYKETNYRDEVRRLLQRMGTEVGRNLLGENIWVDAAFKGHPDDAKLVFTDCRFPNEANAIFERGGLMWRIIRAGVGPINDHPSETGLDDWNFDAYIHNDAELEDFHKSVERKYLEGALV